MAETRNFYVRGRRVETDLSDREAAIVCRDLLPGNPFALSLANQLLGRGRLSPNQLPWLHALAVEAARPRPEPTAPVAAAALAVADVDPATLLDVAGRPTRTFTTTRGDATDSPYADGEALRLCEVATWQGGRDMARQARAGRPLSANQLAWAHRVAVQVADRLRRGRAEAADREGAARTPEYEPILELRTIVNMIARAGESGLKEPRITLPMADDVVLRFGRSRGAERIWVDHGPREGRKTLLGMIDPEGTLTPVAAIPDEVLGLLLEFNDDPVAVSRRLGHVSGRCCYCGLSLTDYRSTAVGFGPVCSRNWGLHEEWKAAAPLDLAAV
jgi:hypothetical protein